MCESLSFSWFVKFAMPFSATGARTWLLLFALLAVALPAAANGSVLILGDSISAGYGVPTGRGWVTLLQARLREQGYDESVINASISGETTGGGRQRLPALLDKHRPSIVVIELGGNDGLRGFPVERLRDNLAGIVADAKDSGARVLLVGIRIPPNYGLRYTTDFHASFTEIARRHALPLVPFMLDGVATQPDLMQDDGIHPNADAQTRLLDNVWPHLQPLLTRGHPAAQ
jgi:acyl-CoA thioesterase-1